MKLFVTGGTGFVGSHFINASIQAGHEIVALRRPQSVSRIPLNKEPLWIEGNLDNEFKKELKGCDALVHLAAHSPNPPYDALDQCLYWNLTASLNLLHQAHDVGIKKFLIAHHYFLIIH